MRKIRITVTNDQCEVLDKAEVEVRDGVSTLLLKQVYPFSNDSEELCEFEIGTDGTVFKKADWPHPDAE